MAPRSNKRWLGVLAIGMLLALLAGGWVWAFPGPSVIHIRDRTGKDLAGVLVSVMPLTGKLQILEVTTDAQGKARFPNPFPWKNEGIISFKIQREGQVIFDACLQTQRFTTNRLEGGGGEEIAVQWDFPIFEVESYSVDYIGGPKDGRASAGK